MKINKLQAKHAELEILFAKQSIKFYKHLNLKDRSRVIDSIDQSISYGLQTKRLQGALKRFRISSGTIRIIFRKNHQPK